MAAPTSVAFEINYSGSTWSAVSTAVKSWSIKQGSEDGSLSGGELTVVLDNFDGLFTPDNPLASNYPNFIEGKAIRVTVTKGTASSRFFGYITAIVPDYPTEPSQSTTTVTALDIIGIASRTKAKPMPLAGINRLRSASAGFYPLTDKSARLGFSDVFGNMTDMRAFGSGSGGQVAAAGDDSFSTDTDPCVSIVQGRGIRHPRGAFTMTNGVIAFYVKPAPNAVNEDVFLRLVSSAGESCYMAYDGVNELIVQGDLLGSLTTFLGTKESDAWHSVVLDVSGGGVNIWVDGEQDTAGVISMTDVVAVELGTDCTFAVRDLYIDPAYTSHLTINALYSKSSGIASSTLAEQTTYWDYILDSTTSWSSSVSGVTACGLLTGGRSALASLESLARSQSGIGYCTYTTTAATINLVANPEAKPTTVALTVDVELDADGGPSLARGLAEKVAEVRVFSSQGETVAVDTAALASLDAATVDVETALFDSAQRRGVGQEILAASAYAKQRITEITLDLVTASNDRYAAFFALTPGERVRVSNLPSTYFGVTYMDGFVTGWVEEGVGDYEYKVTLSLSPADAPSEGVWDTDRWAWGDGVCTASALTSSGTSVTLTWTGSATMSTTGGDYPLDLDINGERVTVSSAPAGSTSPQTVTIVRGVAPTVARAHNAGETVDIWNAARWAM